MKRVLFGVLIFLLAGQTLAADYLNSYEIISKHPKAGDSFKIRLNGDWPNACPSATVSADVYQDKIFIEILVTVSSEVCAQVVTPWSYEVTIPGQHKGFYTVYYRFKSSNPAYRSSDIFLANVPVSLPDIKKCQVISGVLVTSGGFDGSGFGIFNVSGTFSFVDTGNDGWLTDVNLQANDPQNRVGDIAELFRLGLPPVEMVNNAYSKYYGIGKSTLIIEEQSGDDVSLQGVFIESYYDGYQYDLTCTAAITDHALCHKLPAGDANKDCKVDVRDIAVMAYEWLDCQLIDRGDCTQ